MSEPIPTSAPVPALPSTADTTPYVPVSWVAVAAAVVAGKFAVWLVALGLVAFINKKPLLEGWLLAMPVVAVVLSFAARRVIRNSEGTRTGENLATGAWWTAVVLGVCYVAFLFGYDYTISREARGEVDRWIGFLKGGTEDDVARAFHRTLLPGARAGVAPDMNEMRGRFRDELLVFTTSDLIRLAQRNKGEIEFDTASVTWQQRPGTTECVVTGTAKCREGVFPVLVALRGVDGGAGTGRQWVVQRSQAGGFIDQGRAARTPYGHLIQVLEMDGGGFGKGFLSHLTSGPVAHQYVYRAFVLPRGDRLGWGEVATTPGLQLAFAMPSAAFGDAGYADYMNNHFFKTPPDDKHPDGTDAPPAQRAKFLASWNAFGLRPAGAELKGPDGAPIDKENVLTLTETAVEVRVPVEIVGLPPAQPTDSPGTARGRLLVSCNDPPLLALLKRHREAADPARVTLDFPADLRAELAALYEDRANPGRLLIPWRVVRVESNLEAVSREGQRRPGGPGSGGPGGLGGFGGMSGGPDG